MDLSLLVGSLNPINVWDLPLWAWRSYAAYIDQERAEAARQRAERGLHG